MNQDRIARELSVLARGWAGRGTGGQSETRCPLFRRPLPLGNRRVCRSGSDVVVPVPSGYPGGIIDLAGLPVGSPFLDLVKGGRNTTRVLLVPTIGSGSSPAIIRTMGEEGRHGTRTATDFTPIWIT